MMRMTSEVRRTDGIPNALVGEGVLGILEMEQGRIVTRVYEEFVPGKSFCVGTAEELD